MTTLGKILVFANLVFSVITGALIIMVFAVRTNWAAEYKKRAEQLDQAHANAKFYEDEVKKIAAERDNLKATIKAVEDKAKTDVDDLKKTVEQKQADTAKVDAVGKGASATATDATAETKRLQEEVQTLIKSITQRDQKLNEYEVLNKQIAEKAVQAEIAYQGEKQRKEQMMEQNAALTKENERMKAKGSAVISAAGTERRPPPEDVRGTVLSADPKTGLVTISIGSDHGLVSGHTLEVFRIKPKPEYLGQIKILDARHHEAVGRPTSAQKGSLIQKGDEVASKILGQR